MTESWETKFWALKMMNRKSMIKHFLYLWINHNLIIMIILFTIGTWLVPYANQFGELNEFDGWSAFNRLSFDSFYNYSVLFHFRYARDDRHGWHSVKTNRPFENEIKWKIIFWYNKKCWSVLIWNRDISFIYRNIYQDIRS